jgi:hypothetical protein
MVLGNHKDGCRNIAVALIDPLASMSDMAWLQQLSDSCFHENPRI